MKDFFKGMKEDLDILGEIIVVGIFVFGVLSTLYLGYKHLNPTEEPPPMSNQNVVCDLVYGVQYFEYNGNLTLRVNHEGNPIRCFEE